ncbi:unnamed protein product [Durusdinium trenchii]|uniref:Uncharacterized protein n=1 Tax=Durusdinium trenchii TaxID=1381693 RepID=A0ABP0QBV7_9DINO
MMARLTLRDLVWRLHYVGAPKVLTCIVLMLLWSQNVETLSEGFDFLEFWAGKAVTSTVMSHSGRDVAALDIDYYRVDANNPKRSNHYDILTPSGFLLCLTAVLNAKNGRFTALMAIVCSSWTTINMATSGMCLLIYLVEVMGGCWLVEQPSNSLLRFHPRVMWTFSIFRAWSTRWWMGHYGAKTPKRHVAWSSSPKVGLLNRGKLSWASMRGRDYDKHKTAVTGVSKSGKKTFQGRKQQLKASQTYPYKFGLRILRIVNDLQSTGCRTFPPVPESFNPLACYQEQAFTDLWVDCGMDECLKYLYGNRHLKVPPEWKPLLLPTNS